MRQTQTNSVALRTRQAIADAFLSMIRERAYEDISVTDICARAEVVRKTFYNHFQSKDDVVCCLISDFTGALESLVDIRHMRVRDMLLIAFQSVVDHREMLLLFYERGLFRFAHRSISDYITKSRLLTGMSGRIDDERVCPYIAAQIPAMLISVIETWIVRGLEEPVEFLADLTEKLMVDPNAIFLRADGPPAG